MSKDSPFAGVGQWLSSIAWMDWGQRLLTAALLLGIAVAVTLMLRHVLARLRNRSGVDAPAVYIVEKLGGYIIIGIGLIAALQALGLDLGSVTLFSGAIGVGLGLGLQGVVKEFASGLVLIFDPAVQIGDFVELESGVRGEIVEIGTRATRMRTNDNLNIVVPNSTIIQGRVTNWTYNKETRRIHVPFTVAEKADKAKVREAVLAAARALPFTRPDDNTHKTQVWLIGFSGNGLEFELIVWPSSDSSRHPANMHAAYTWAIHDALLAAEIDSASPQLDLRVNSLFGRRGEEALRTLKLPDRAVRKPHATAEPPAAETQNDAAVSMHDAQRRDAQAAAEPVRPRPRPQ